MRNRQFVGVLTVVALAVGAGYFFGRSRAGTNPATTDPSNVATQISPGHVKSTMQAGSSPTHKPMRMHLKSHYTVAPTPLPPPDTPLALTYAQLKALADAGDAQAASRLYRDLKRCAQARDIQNRLPFLERIATRAPRDNPTSGQLNFQEHMMDYVQRRMDLVSDSQAFCAGVTNEQLANLTPTTLQAAQHGDEQALDCYLGSNLNRMPGVLDHPEWLTDYKQNALELADTALQNGDWTAVRLLQAAYHGSYYTPLLGQLTGTDPEQSYRYLQLQRLGTTSDSDSRLDQRIATATQDLTPQQIADANAWAEQTYSQYFNSTAPDSGPGSLPDCLQNGR